MIAFNVDLWTGPNCSNSTGNSYQDQPINQFIIDLLALSSHNKLGERLEDTSSNQSGLFGLTYPIVGAILGGLLLCCCCIVIVAVILIRKRRKSKRKTEDGDNEQAIEMTKTHSDNPNDLTTISSPPNAGGKTTPKGTGPYGRWYGNRKYPVVFSILRDSLIQLTLAPSAIILIVIREIKDNSNNNADTTFDGMPSVDSVSTSNSSKQPFD